MTDRQPTSLWAARGGSDGPLLVLLHGLGANSSVWTKMLPAVEASWKGRWIAPDFRGHGQSPFAGPYGFGCLAADVAALITDEKPGTVSVVGHSLGGVVGALLGSGLFGRQVGHLFAFDVKLNWTADDIAKSQEIARKPARVFATKPEAIERYLKGAGLFGLVDPASDLAGVGVMAVAGGYQVRMDPAAFGVAGPSIPALFSLMNVPFRLAAGAADPMVSAADMQAIDKDAIVIPDAGHNVHYEQPKRLWDAVAGELKLPT